MRCSNGSLLVTSASLLLLGSAACDAPMETPRVRDPMADAHISATTDAGMWMPDPAVDAGAWTPDPEADAAVASPDAAGEPPDGPPLDCGALASAGFEVCEASAERCGTVFRAREGCAAVCASAGLVCVEGWEDVDGMCAADRSRAALGCAATGHASDYCVCGREAGPCTPRTCSDMPLACGVVADGCGGNVDCSATTCAAGTTCTGGTCRGEVRCAAGDCPAFPGAEGYGRNAEGGRGGDVYHVTSLGNSGSGTLRDAVTTARGPRTIVFDVAGIIDLTAPLRADVSRLTIAGQTAPGDGITVRGYQVDLQGDDLIVQHLRFRAGDIRKKTSSRDGFTEDSLTISGNDVIVDHVSASWGIDENLSTHSESWDRMTVQWSIVSEGLYHTELFHGEYDPSHHGHSMGSLFKPRTGNSHVSVHHSLYAHNGNRNPALGGYSSTQTQWAQIVNNVLYDWRDSGYTSGETARTHLDYIGNYGIFGASSSDRHLFEPTSECHVQLYQSGNYRDLDRDGRFDGTNDGWGVFTGDYTRASARVTDAPITTQDAPTALMLVLDQSGARPWSRDSVDRRVVEDVRTGRGRVIDSQEEVGGWGTLAEGSRVVDGDRDGMPDDYERMAGTSPTRADDDGDVDGDGYTNLENYLHWASRYPR